LIVLSLITLSSLNACSLYTVDSQYSSSEFFPPKSSLNDVQVLETVEQPHEIIGTVKVNAERHQKMENILERMKREAAILGGDAITNIRTNAGKGKWAQIKPKDLFGNSNVRTNFIADVIIFKK